MYREVIHSNPSWKKGEITAPQRDCVFIAKGDAELQDGFRGLLVAQVHLFLSFRHEGITYPCALVHWFSTFGEEPDPDTGIWMVVPDRVDDGYYNAMVVHLDTIVRGAHLLTIFKKDFADTSLNFTETLDMFDGYYVNKYIDHHAHEIAF